MSEYICNNKKYKYGKGYIYLPVSIANIPSSITFAGHELLIKESFHISLVCVKDIVTKYRGGSELEEKILKFFCQHVTEKPIEIQELQNEFRFVQKEDRKSIIVMCTMTNLGDFFLLLKHELGIDFEIPPTHITLYTLQAGKGIGVVTQKELFDTTVVVNLLESISPLLCINKNES